MQSWLMQKITRHSLQIITRCKSCVLLVAEVSRCKKITRHSLQAKPDSLCLFKVNKYR